MKIKDSFKETFKDVKNVLVVLAHPDDMEISCGGLIIRLIDNGVQVRLVATTNGGKGMKDKKGLKEEEYAKQRVAEQFKAGKVLGIEEVENFNLEIPDGELEASVENIGKIAFHIRQFKPDLVITHNPDNCIIEFFNRSTWVNHRDHRNTALITIDAVYPYSRDRGFFTSQFEKDKLEPHTVKKLLLTDSYTAASVKFFAIDNYLSKKKIALQQHLTAFDPSDADDYLQENKFENGYYEPLGFYEVY
ncbi:hypothetical protein A2686_04215 [Candidatus Woesebacteria bacterium RIFCSPHIGHO2_01_FULL_38_10]|uniref:GlcNAc-PI de-N-acetylase n=1 Tax=Candidatus Woesebacteria bacterium RIFCSPLOWO2_01_FULL_39_10b TaxID=1802517 RepID=A0A1F8B8I1_9BACT|nr:MAG: hypothetical protein A2686_04215 [Candidatus Woesebacteria bacterium RIFCSPHIGHO2_01_FULL_38_10]OGM60321.1 MAG: hypothetical protein A2892_03175 [Candidatus Woesebacteria bacterium RIFCSPLOWO2_01_FULL_39_10b]